MGVHDFDQKKACFVPWRVPLQLVQLVLRAGHYVGIYRTGALVQYLSNAEMQYPKSITNKAIKSQMLQYFRVELLKYMIYYGRSP